MLTVPPRDSDVPLPNPLPSHDRVPRDDVRLSWTVHLLRGASARLPRVGLSILVVLIGGLFLFHNPVLALLPTLALVLSLSEFLFPSHYTLSAQGAQVRYGLMTLEIPWRDVRRVYLCADGIKLSPLSRPNSRLEPLRGVFLRFGDNAETVADVVRTLRQEAANDA